MLAATYLLHILTGETGGVIRSGTVPVPWHVRRELYWISLPHIEVLPAEVPHWLAEVFGNTAPLAAATAGGVSDYLVVQWPAGFDLAQLPVPQGLGMFTPRALIATCESCYSHGLARIESRYFAPQYGVSEDAATGSAMRVLALYWQAQGLGREISNYQRSANGGLLFSEVADDFQIYIGGRVAPADEEQSTNVIS